MVKGIIHAEIDEGFVPVEGINHGLISLCRLAEDSKYLEEILNTTMQNLYKTLPMGEKNYGKSHESKIGNIWIRRSMNDDGNSNITYAPSIEYENKFGYVSKRIGIINLREKSVLLHYSQNFQKEDYDESFWELPGQLMKDTIVVMKMLGLKEITKK